MRFDGNVPALPAPAARPGAIAGALAEINTYPHGGYRELMPAIAAYAGVGPDNVVLGAGADDLIFSVLARSRAREISAAIAAEPTYPLYRHGGAAGRRGGGRGSDPVVTFMCRPNNPTRRARRSAGRRGRSSVDEAYFEYAGETARRP